MKSFFSFFLLLVVPNMFPNALNLLYHVVTGNSTLIVGAFPVATFSFCFPFWILFCLVPSIIAHIFLMGIIWFPFIASMIIFPPLGDSIYRFLENYGLKLFSDKVSLMVAQGIYSLLFVGSGKWMKANACIAVILVSLSIIGIGFPTFYVSPESKGQPFELFLNMLCSDYMDGKSSIFREGLCIVG
jgi:hypothetical protein